VVEYRQSNYSGAVADFSDALALTNELYVRDRNLTGRGGA
jgi:hypothetical protein